MSPGANKNTLLLVIVVVAFGEFLLDLVTPHGMADWVLYFIPLLLSAYVGGRNFSYLLAGLLSLLNVVGWLLSPLGAPSRYTLAGRLIGIGVFWVMAWFISRRRKLAESLHVTERALRTVSECNKALVRAADEPELLRQICQIIVEKGGYRLAWVGFAENDAQKSIRLAASAGFDEGYLEQAKITWSAADERGLGPSGVAIRTGEVVVCNNFQADASTVPWREAAAKRGYAASIVLPLRNTGKTFGILTLYAPRINAFNAVEVSLLSELADDLAYGIHAQRIRAEHERTEAALRRSETKYRNIFENVQDIFYQTDNSGTIVDISPSIERYSGYRRDELIGKPVEEVYYYPEDRAGMLKRLWEKGEVVDYEVRLKTKNGSLVYTSVNAHGLFDSEGKPAGIEGSLRDITGRKLDEEALLQTNERIRHLNNVLHAIQDVRDLLNREKDSAGLLTAVCQSLVKTRGYVTVWVGKPDAASKRVLPVAHSGGEHFFLSHAPITWDDSPFGQGPTGMAIRERRVAVFNDIASDPRFAPWRNAVLAVVPGRSASVASIPLLFGERLFGALTIKADHKNAFDAEELELLTGLAADVARALHNLEEEAVRRLVEESHVRLATAVEQAAETILITDTNGMILYANPAFEKSTGYTRAEAVGKNPRILKSGRQDAGFYCQMWNTITRGEVWEGHFINRKKDGTFFEEEATITPIRDAAGVVVNYVAVKRDVTRELQLEAQFRQAQKMEAIGTLAGGIAHDFNNILTAMFGYCYLLQLETAGNPPAQEKIAEILKSAERAKDLVQQILTFSRRREQERQIIHLDSIVKEATKFLRASLPANIKIDLKLAADTPPVLADATQIYQVTVNLGTNALHAMEGGQPGQLTVRLEAFQPDEALIKAQPGLRAIPYARLTIADTGHGMDAQILERIFEPFFTTKPVGKGTGLGLAVVHGIIQAHDGVITVESRPNQGTTFRLYFPAQTQDMTLTGKADAKVPDGQGQRILLVDDETALTAMYQRLLKLLKYEPTITNSARAAVGLVRENPAQFDLVITDLTMPEMNGLEVARQIRALRADLPVILATGFSATLTREHLRDAGICELVEKPVSLATLAEVLHKILGKK